MAKVLVNETSLNSIAAAIREKNGETTKYKPSEMAAAITALVIGGGGSGGGIPEEKLVLTGDCQRRFYAGGWDWVIEDYGDKITSHDISSLNYMFGYSKLEEIPFTLNATNTADWQYAFFGATNLKYIAPIPVLKTSMSSSMFSGCNNLRYLPEVETMEMAKGQSAGVKEVIYGCYSLREIPDNYMNGMTGDKKVTSASSHFFKNFLSNSYALNEVNNIRVNSDVSLTSNVFSGAFAGCHRVKNITFKTKDDGSPYVASWAKQTIELQSDIGWVTYDTRITMYNSGITSDKKVADAASYAALKNDPDWYSGDVYYSRFNHTSAVNMINSLPDTSAFTANNGANTIKFRSDAGYSTDGGRIGSLTEEEIAVATAKGWVISYAV